ncbi:O-methyltransferase [Bacillus benzoevorans]|uniref:tRNA 5-hydroxyuridine methyltransferase n=1 Tax=Bacillus benzoevorans TaxID=1456 RepID=A0A7X0LX12_9BACI|nr:O-methyltransferase [Bacillus benzoevorans]MBB6445934.1 putative O-methyltransferase YrrM [Bacillus benzoevorans]
MQNDKIHAYIENLIPERPEFFMKMEKYAADYHVPIMEPAGMEAMLQILRILEPERILEVGTAIGYSALRMAYAVPDVSIVTIERDEERVEMAEENFAMFGREQIHLIKGDALEMEEEAAKYAPYDAIFIDAAKGQYQRFFELYSRYLTERGIIITDNVLFKGLVAEETIEHKRTNGLVKKIKHFNEWLMSHPDYDTVILPVGDGVAISKKGCKG